MCAQRHSSAAPSDSENCPDGAAAAGQRLPCVDDPNRPRDDASVRIALTRDEPGALEALNHMIDRRCRDESMSLDIRLRRGDAKPDGVLLDEVEILTLALRWLPAA